MSQDELIAYGRETERIARANHALALTLWDSVFPPWRWAKWWRTSREVKRGIAETQRRRAIFRAEAESQGFVLP